jgi:hypothetical protein
MRQIGQFLDIGRAEVVALDRLSDFVVLRQVAGRRKFSVFQDFHEFV